MKIAALFVFLLCLFAPVPVQAATPLDMDSFAAIPIQHEGRVKPLDTFARASLRKFSGGDTLEGQSASQWLALTIFDPASSLETPVFRIFKPSLVGLPERENKLYSFADLSGALRAKSSLIEKLAQTDAKNWSEDQIELMRLQEHSILYAQMLRSLSLTLPLNLAMPEALAKSWSMEQDTSVTLRTLEPHQKALSDRVGKIIAAKGDDPDSYSKDEKAIVDFAFNLDILKQGGQANILFRVLPTGEEWQSPWSAPDAPMIETWERAAKAYLSADNEEFTAATKILSSNARGFKTSLELSYNAYHPLGLATALYLLSFLFFAAQAVWDKKTLYTASLATLGIAVSLNIFAIAARVAILSRPPVGTLYESILFVAALCALVTLFMEMKRKDGNGLLAGSLSGVLLLFIAQGFAAEDTMQMLVAVLNTNFWLATHVLCITTGYAICLLASFFAHLHLFRAARGQSVSAAGRAARTLGLFALLFTTIGTILGGIWADQSWGRFWGWDPKENGALFIVLWIIWIYHGNLSGHIRGNVFAAGLAALSVVVALAWFGVNLLNVGLHSYGFITGVAASLAAFCAVEALIIGALWWKAHERERRNA